MKWEYQTVVLRYFTTLEERNKTLNEWGDEGWELVSVDNEMAYLKRPVIDEMERPVIDKKTLEKIKARILK